jgi:hypothetical protein
LPQFCGSVAVLLQLVPHSVLPVGQVHAPPEQESPAPHGLPQPPQFAGSVFVSTQRPPHRVPPPAHAHWPAMHELPPLQARPHAPQWALLVAVSTHAPAHSLLPSGHEVLGAAASLAGRAGTGSGPTRRAAIHWRRHSR